MVTRAVSVLQRGPQLVVAVPGTTGNSTESEGSQNITWNERFMLMLPPALAEQLLCPAPGDNPFAGISLELKISVYDGSGRSGMGLLIGTATVPVRGKQCVHWHDVVHHKCSCITARLIGKIELQALLL